jgi:hypothetical protein
VDTQPKTINWVQHRGRIQECKSNHDVQAPCKTISWGSVVVESCTAITAPWQNPWCKEGDKVRTL